MNTSTNETQLPLLRGALPPIPPLVKRPKVAVQEAKTQDPLIWQSQHSFLNQFDGTLSSYSGCPFKCGYCYVPDLQWGLPERLGGWGNYVHPRSRCAEYLRRHIEELDGTSLFMSATTDPYNPFEGQYLLTRKLLETLVESKMSFLLISTRGTLVLRDLDIFTDARMKGRIEIGISILSDLDETVHTALEPFTPSFRKRFTQVAYKLKKANVPVRIQAAPLALHSADFYTMAADCADWLWMNEPHHSAGGNPAFLPWFYTEAEAHQLTEAAQAHPQLGPARIGYGRDQFAYRWDAQRQGIVPPPPRVKFHAGKKRKQGS